MAKIKIRVILSFAIKKQKNSIYKSLKNVKFDFTKIRYRIVRGMDFQTVTVKSAMIEKWTRRCGNAKASSTHWAWEGREGFGQTTLQWESGKRRTRPIQAE